MEAPMNLRSSKSTDALIIQRETQNIKICDGLRKPIALISLDKLPDRLVI